MTSVRPDPAMVYAAIILRLRSQGMHAKRRAELERQALKIRATLTGHEIRQVKKLLSLGSHWT